VVGRLALEERLSLQDFFKLHDVPRLELDGGQMGAWATLGVLTDRTAPKKNGSGHNFMVLKLGDLRGTTVPLFLFGDAFREHWALELGSVVVALGAKLRRGDDGETALSIDRPEQMFRAGASADMAVCRGTRRDGKPCSMVINRSEGEYCHFHAVKAYKRLQTQRSNVAGGNLTQPMRRRQVALEREQRRGAAAAAGGGGLAALRGGGRPGGPGPGPGPGLGRSGGAGATRGRGRSGGAAAGGGARVQGQRGTMTLPRTMQSVAQLKQARASERGPLDIVDSDADFGLDRELIRGFASRFEAGGKAAGAGSAASRARARAAREIREGRVRIPAPDPNAPLRRGCPEVPARGLLPSGGAGSEAAVAAAFPPVDSDPPLRRGAQRPGARGNAALLPTTRANQRPQPKGRGGGGGQQRSAFGQAFAHVVSEKERNGESEYAHLVDREAEGQRKARLDALQEQDQLYKIIEGQTSRKRQRLFCLECREWIPRGPAAAKTGCLAKRHKCERRDATEYFFECGGCGNRLQQWARHPTQACRKCGRSGQWRPASVVAEKKVHAEAVAAKENFKARGVEHAFSLRS